MLRMYKKTLASTSLIASVLLLSGCFSEEAQQQTTIETIRPVKLFTVEDTSQTNYRRFPATTVANKQVEASFRIAGQLSTLPVYEGQLVQKGTLLASLDQRDAKTSLLNAEANFELAESNFERIRALLKKKLVSQSEYDSSKAQLKSARAALNSAQNSLDYTQIHAPFDGIIARLPVENYQYVAPQQTIAVLQSTDKIDIRIQVPEDLYQIASRYTPFDQYTSHVVFPSRPDLEIAASLREFSSEIDSATRSYPVTFTMEAQDAINIVAGMSAELFFDMNMVGHITQSHVIPHQAVMMRDSDGKQVVWIYSEEKQTVHARPVELGRVLGKGVEVTAGLNVGDKLVTAGIVNLTEGMKVKPLTWERGI